MVAILIIKAYRAIPRPVRRLWSNGQSTSHLALADVTQSSAPWSTLAMWAMPRLRDDELWFTKG